MDTHCWSLLYKDNNIFAIGYQLNKNENPIFFLEINSEESVARIIYVSLMQNMK